MSKVYVVTAGSYSDYRISKIFSTREKAQEYIDTMGLLGGMMNEDFNGIEEWELDDFNISKVYITYYLIHDIFSPERVEVWTQSSEGIVPPDHLTTYSPAGTFRFFFSLPYSKRIINAPNKDELLLKIAHDRLAKYKAEAMEF